MATNVAFVHPGILVHSIFTRIWGFLWLSALLLPVASVAVKSRSVVASRENTTGASSTISRACRDDELAEYALLFAVGPAQAPSCIPAPRQSLSAPTLPAAPITALLDGAEDSFGQTGVHFVHLHVVQSDAVWCKLPCDAPSWELAAPKPEKGSPYVLVEAAIWRQFRTVTLYQFDAAWEKLARNSYQQLCGGRAWGCAAYENHRKSKELLTVGPWPAELDTQPLKLSQYIQNAFAKVFGEINAKVMVDVQKDTGKDNAHIGLTYSGHGGDADGSLFNGVVNSPNAVSLLKSLVDAGGRFSMFNFGTNCQEGFWAMLAAMHPFADWILASELKVGGLNGGQDPAEDMRHIKAKEKLSDVAVLKRTMEARQTPKQAVAEIVKARGQLWSGAMEQALTRQKLKQSVSAFAAPKFPAFAAAMKSALEDKLSDAKQQELQTFAENHQCDVLSVAKFIDSVPEGMFLQQKSKTILSKGAGPLEKLFRAFRPDYVSTRSLFTWDKVTHGFVFNHRGAWQRDDGSVVPRCDLSVIGAPPL